ncbi:MAG: hypothetical protein M2R45_01226 [Verrucomicrobia subdivision 3 bacterium]|nr:hypothetical protein [Limisphaerales bacterium]MCS1415222.1 hypothetical protein [Limisphaerales bacterium]
MNNHRQKTDASSLLFQHFSEQSYRKAKRTRKMPKILARITETSTYKKNHHLRMGNANFGRSKRPQIPFTHLS